MELRQVNYGAFSDALHRGVGDASVPLSGTIEITRRCPLSCVHCYNNLPMQDPVAAEELTYEEHCRILDDLSAAGCLWLLYTGGEILARRDFLDIYTYAKRKGFLITLFTNGTLITESVAEYLAAWRPFSIEITLYGRTRETYERLTGVPGSFDRCIRGIHLLLERGLPLKLKTVAVSVNKHEVFDMQRFAEELGLEFKFDSMMNPRIDCSQSPLAVRLSPEECVEFDMVDVKRMDEWRLFAERFFGPVHTPETEHLQYHCGGGVTSFAISPVGELSICVLSQQDRYPLKTGSFREGWDGFLRQVRTRPVTRPTKCVRCELKSMCGMCPANGELESGDAEEPVDFLCQVAHLRAYAFGLPIAPHGDCEYCEQGARTDELKATARRLQQILPGTTTLSGPRRVPLQMSGAANGCDPGGCRSCGPAPHAAPDV